MFEPAIVIVGSIGPVTNVLENSRLEIPIYSLSVNRHILNCTRPDSRNIWRNNSWIGTPRVKEGIFSPSRDLTKNSSLWSCTDSIKPLDTSVHGSTTQERSLNLSCIEKNCVKSVRSEINPDLARSKWVKLANSVLSESPKF